MATVATEVFSIRIPKTLIKGIDKLADLTDRSKSYIGAQALAEYVDENVWLIEESQKGLEDVKMGRVVSEKDADIFFADLVKDILKQKKR